MLESSGVTPAMGCPAVLLIGAFCLAAQVPEASAAGQIEAFSVSTSTSQAGGHPDLAASFTLADPGSPETAKSIALSLPPGFTTIPTAIPKCTSSDFALDQCPINSQAGLITVYADYEGNPDDLLGTAPVYEVEPSSGQLGRFAFVMPIANTPVEIPFTLRSAGDYGMRIAIEDAPQLTPLAGANLSLWGFPAESGHDLDRFPRGSPGEPANCPGLSDASCNTEPSPSNLPPHPLLENPTSCADAPLSASLELQTYQEPSVLTSAERDFPAATGCELLVFDPVLYFAPTTTETRSRTGFDLRLVEPQFEGFASAPTQLKAASVSIQGLAFESNIDEAPACTPAQAAINTEETPSCPADTQVGRAEVEGPQFPEPVSGTLYFGGPIGEGSFRVYLLAANSGLDLRLPLTLERGSQSGTISIEVSNLPQIPIVGLLLQLERQSGLLRTDNKCETSQVARAVLSPWDAELSPEESTQLYRFNSGPGGIPCPGPAATVDVSLTPDDVSADGNAVVTATAEVADSQGQPVVGDQVAFTSSDPKEQIGPVLDNEDGTYSARIVSSTTPGAATITATDLSVSPNVSGSTTLEQIGKPSGPVPPPSPPAAVPIVTITRHPPARSRGLSPAFSFTSSVPGAAFFCQVDQTPSRPCTTPMRATKLAPGHHLFRVYATSGAVAGEPAAFRFVIVAPHHKRHHRPRSTSTAIRR